MHLIRFIIAFFHFVISPIKFLEWPFHLPTETGGKGGGT